jgi:thiol-disulfide isomerase/thioredoxin
MLRTIIMFFIACCIAAPTVSCQESLKFDDAKTIQEVEASLEKFAQKLHSEIKDDASYAKASKTLGETFLAASEKILTLAKNDEEREKSVMLKISGFQQLIGAEQISAPRKKSENLKKLITYIDELEKEGKYPRLVNAVRFQNFAQSAENISNQKGFENIKKEAVKWVNIKLDDISPIDPLKVVVSAARRAAWTKDPKFLENTVKELVAFVKSAECTLSEDEKQNVANQLEGILRCEIGAELKLYGKTLDNKDFDWKALRGKYVVVKFTAWWCGPCKREIPGMLEAYKKYHDKGLEIVSVYLWDRGKVEDSKKAVEEEKLPWLVVSETYTQEAKQPAQGAFYGIEGVPTMLLIDKEGKVVETEFRGEKLQKKLAELFK